MKLGQTGTRCGPPRFLWRVSKYSEPSQEPRVQENLSGGVNLGFVFRKFNYFVQLNALGGKVGLECFSSEG